MIPHLLEVAHHLRAAVAFGDDPLVEVWARQVQHRSVDRRALVVEQRLGVVAEQFFELGGGHRFSSHVRYLRIR